MFVVGVIEIFKLLKDVFDSFRLISISIFRSKLFLKSSSQHKIHETESTIIRGTLQAGLYFKFKKIQFNKLAVLS